MFVPLVKLLSYFFVLASLFLLLLKSMVKLVLTSQVPQANSHLPDEHDV